MTNKGDNMIIIRTDFDKTVKKMKPMPGVGQPPFYGIDNKMFHYLTEAGIPYSRLHDVAGDYGGGRFVDVPNIFRNFDADPYDPASYDFVFTDWLITELVKAGCEPYYRLGITIENDADMRAYHTEPPADFHKWAVICEHIIAHYNEGWANGYHYHITYWEIWNEPDGTVPGFPYKAELWNGTPEQFYELYDVAAKHLKSRFGDTIKIGGYACTGLRGIFMTPEQLKGTREELFLNFFKGFFRFIKQHNSPIDFFSWHTYNTVDQMIELEKYLQEQLKLFGYEGLENHINEWNPVHNERGTARHNAHILACMIAMQNAHVEEMNIYDARYGVSSYAALFNPANAHPFPAYYGMVAFNELYKLGTETLTEIYTCDENFSAGEAIYALSASDGNSRKTIIVNLSDKERTLSYEKDEPIYHNAWVIDEEHLLGWTPTIKCLKPYQALLIEW